MYFPHLIKERTAFNSSSQKGLRGRPEMSMCSAYEIPSHKRGRGFAKMLKSHNFLKLYFMFTICLW